MSVLSSNASVEQVGAAITKIKNKLVSIAGTSGNDRMTVDEILNGEDDSIREALNTVLGESASGYTLAEVRDAIMALGGVISDIKTARDNALNDVSSLTTAANNVSGNQSSGTSAAVNALGTGWQGVEDAIDNVTSGHTSNDYTTTTAATAIGAIHTAKETAEGNEAYIKDKADNLTGDSGSETTRNVADHLTSQFSTLAGTIASKTGSTAPTTLGGADTAVSGLPSAQDLADAQDSADALLAPIKTLTGDSTLSADTPQDAQAAATALSTAWAETSGTPPQLSGGLVYAVKQKNASAQLGTTSTMSEVTTAISNIQTGQPPAPTFPLTDGQSNTLADNTIFTGSSMTDIQLALPQSVPTGFICEVYFSTSSSTVRFQPVSGCTILGDDCSLNSSNVVVFEPKTSKSYSILFTETNGSVFAYVVDTTSNA